MPSKRKTDRTEIPSPKRAKFIQHYINNIHEDKSIAQIAREVDIKPGSARRLAKVYEDARKSAQEAAIETVVRHPKRPGRPQKSTKMPVKLPKPIHFGSFLVTNQVFCTTPLSFALVNLKPLLPGHVLVSPIRVVPRFADLSKEEVTDLFSTVQRVSRLVERVFEASALNIAIQDGKAAGQSVPHVHTHIIPRKEGDLDHKGGSDAIYEMMNGQEGDLSSTLQKGSGQRNLSLDNGEQREARSDEEMKTEATWLASEMEKME